MIRFEKEILDRDLKKLKALFDEGLRELVRSFIQEVVQEIAYKNPLGDVESQKKLYQLRNKFDSRLSPNEEGISANNWRVAFRAGAGGLVQSYGKPGEQIGINAYNKLDSYKLGQTVYIVNNAPHINQVMTGEYHLPVGNGQHRIIRKQPMFPEVLGVIQTSYITFNQEVGKLQMKLNS